MSKRIILLLIVLFIILGINVSVLATNENDYTEKKFQTLQEKNIKYAKKEIFDIKNSYFVELQLKAIKNYKNSTIRKNMMKSIMNEMQQYSKTRINLLKNQEKTNEKNISSDRLEYNLQNLICALSSIIKINPQEKYIQALEKAEELLEELYNDGNLDSINSEYEIINKIR